MNAHISKVTLLNKQDFLKILMKSDMNLIWIYMQMLGLVYFFRIFLDPNTHMCEPKNLDFNVRAGIQVSIQNLLYVKPIE